MAAKPGSQDQTIFDTLKEFPRLSVREIAELTDIKYTSLKDIMPRLERANKVQSDTDDKTGKQGRSPKRYSLTGTKEEKPTVPQRDKAVGNILGSHHTKFEFQELRAQYGQLHSEHDQLLEINFKLQDELVSLRLWKERAIMRFPELKVSPVILQAREILGSKLEGPARENVLSGKNDHTGAMQAVIEALEIGGQT